MKKVLCLLAAFAAMLVFVSNSVAEESHEGKIVSAGSGKLVMTDKDGKNEHTHQVPIEATITFDGKDCKLDDLMKDSWVKVTTEKRGDATVVTKIEAKKAKDKP